MYLTNVSPGVYFAGTEDSMDAGYFLIDIDDRLFGAEYSSLSFWNLHEW